MIVGLEGDHHRGRRVLCRDARHAPGPLDGVNKTPGSGSAFMARTFNHIPPSVNAQKQGPVVAGVAGGDNGDTGAVRQGRPPGRRQAPVATVVLAAPVSGLHFSLPCPPERLRLLLLPDTRHLPFRDANTCGLKSLRTEMSPDTYPTLTRQAVTQGR